MMHKIIYHSDPPVKTELLTLEEVISLVDGTRKKVCTKHAVLWLLNTESTVKAFYKDIEIKEGATYTDNYHNCGRAVLQAIDSAKYLCKHYKVEANDPLEVKVHTIVWHVPTVCLKDDDENNLYVISNNKYMYNGEFIYNKLIAEVTTWSSRARKPFILKNFINASTTS